MTGPWVAKLRRLFGATPAKCDRALGARWELAAAWSEVTTLSPREWDWLLVRFKDTVQLAQHRGLSPDEAIERARASLRGEVDA